MQIEYVPSNSTKVLHIRRKGWRMNCGQSLSNLTVTKEDFPDYKICKKCEKG